jgi:DNA-directed RNA polymerase subunit RPC12/RpoP
MDIVCDKCGGKNIYIVRPEPEKEAPKKMSEMSSVGISTLVYKMTTLKCNDCGFEHSY